MLNESTTNRKIGRTEMFPDDADVNIHTLRLLIKFTFATWCTCDHKRRQQKNDAICIQQALFS